MTDESHLSASDVEDGTRRWYTVPEAAEYLGVSQPTIFRWMKENTLSFYKVGGATRFQREGLDAVIEKTTGIKEAEQRSGRCMSCGHSILLEGQLRGSGLLYFRPSRAKFWVLSEAMVATKARVCPACGLVQLHADTEHLQRLVGGGSDDKEVSDPSEP